MTQPNPPEVPFDTVLDEILVSLSKTMHDGGINHAEAKQAIKDAIQALVTAQKPTDKRNYNDEYNQVYSDGWNDALDLYRTNLLEALKKGSEL